MHDNVRYLYDSGWRETSISGSELKGCCPYHEDNNPSFSINSETGYFNCYACNQGGKTLTTLIMYCEGLSLEEAQEKLGGKPDATPRTVVTNAAVHSYCHAVLTADGAVGKKIQEIRECVKTYLEERRYNPDLLIKKYKLGYTHIRMPQRLIEKKIFNKHLEQTGFTKGGMYYTADRLLIPINFHKMTVGFSLRSIGYTMPKYLNIWDKTLYPQNTWLAGLEKHKGQEVFVVEGIFDVIRMKEYGYEACALMGSSLSPKRMAILKNFETIYLMLDRDAAGIRAIEKIFCLARQSCPESVLKVCTLPSGKDPDDCDVDEINFAIKNAQPIFEWIVKKYLFECSLDEHAANLARLKSLVIKHVFDPHELNLFESAIDSQLMNAESWLAASYSSVNTVVEFISKQASYNAHPVINMERQSDGFKLNILDYEYRFNKEGRPVSSTMASPVHKKWTVNYQGRN